MVAAVSGWVCPLLTFIYPGFDCGSGVYFFALAPINSVPCKRCKHTIAYYTIYIDLQRCTNERQRSKLINKAPAIDQHGH